MKTTKEIHERLKAGGLRVTSQRLLVLQILEESREHYHFTCLGCGRIIEVCAPRIEQACREMAEKLGLVFTRANVCLEGYCPACAARGED